MAAVRDELRDDLDGCDARLDGQLRRAAMRTATRRGARARLKTILSELHYVRTLLRDVEKELGAAWNGIVGIDLGTTNSLIAYLDDDGARA